MAAAIVQEERGDEAHAYIDFCALMKRKRADSDAVQNVDATREQSSAALTDDSHPASSSVAPPCLRQATQLLRNAASRRAAGRIYRIALGRVANRTGLLLSLAAHRVRQWRE